MEAPVVRVQEKEPGIGLLPGALVRADEEKQKLVPPPMQRDGDANSSKLKDIGTQLTEVKAYNNEDAETARDLPRLPSLQSKSSKKKALELGAVVLSDNLFRRPFTTSFTLKTNAANLPVVQVHASGAASSSGNAPATAFCICAPTVPGEDPQRSVHFSFSSPVEAEQKKRTAMLEEQKARLLPLLSQMPQAAFLGHGTETKRDTPKGVTFTKRVTTVRDALQLPADKFQVEVGGVPLADYLKQCGALARIQSGLQIETGIDIELYSLNVYQQGGHFLKHKDTPRGDDTFGTLVVGLGGCYYEGGSMTISDSALPHIFAHDLLGLGFGDPSSVQVPDPTMLRCAAFFSDFDHELHEVTSGILMTVAFLMKRADKSSAASLIPRRLTQLEQEKKLADMLRELLHDKEFLANGGTVGFPCSHLYTNSEVFPGKDRAADRALTGQQILQLKGKDAVIGRAVDTVQRKVGGDLELFLTPYLTYYPDVFSGILTPWGDYLLSRFPVGTKVPRRMDDDEIARHFKAIGDASDHLVGEVGRTRLRARDMVDVWALPEEFSHRAKFAGQTYFGNKASEVDFYVKSFFRLVFPPYLERKDVGPEVTELGVEKITALWKKLSSVRMKCDVNKYAFWEKREPDLDQPASDLKVMAALEQELKKQVANPLFLQKGGQLMFPCQSTYSHVGLFPPAIMMKPAQKKAKDDEFRNRLTKTAAHGSSAAPLLAEAAAPPAMKKAKAKSAREVLDKNQIEKLESAEKLVALAAEKAGLSMKFRIYEAEHIYETYNNDDPDYVRKNKRKPFEHDILSTFPPKLPKSMCKSDFLRRKHYGEDLCIGTLNSRYLGENSKTQHWMGELVHGARELNDVEFDEDFSDDFTDDSAYDDDGNVIRISKRERPSGALIYRTALSVMVPAAEKRTTGVSSSSSGGQEANINDAGAAPTEKAGSKASAVGARAKVKAAAPKAKAQSKAAKAGASKAKAKPAKAKAKAKMLSKQAAAKMKTVKKKCAKAKAKAKAAAPKAKAQSKAAKAGAPKAKAKPAKAKAKAKMALKQAAAKMKTVKKK